MLAFWHQQFGCPKLQNFREDLAMSRWSDSQQSCKKIDNGEQLIGWPNAASSNKNADDSPASRIYPTCMSQNPTLGGSNNNNNNSNNVNGTGKNVNGATQNMMQNLDGLVIGGTDGNLYWIGKDLSLDMNYCVQLTLSSMHMYVQSIYSSFPNVHI